MSETAKPADALLSTTDVLKRLGIGQTTLWRMERRGEFPKPLVLGQRVKRWRSSDIEAFIRGKAGAS